MRVEIVVDRAAARAWHARLRGRLIRLLPDADIRFSFAAGDNGLPSPAEHLITLERLLLRQRGASLWDRAELAGAAANADFQPDVVIDCTGREPAAQAGAARTLRPLYDGHASERAAAAALLGGASPAIGLENSTDGRLAAVGLPSLEAADGLTGGMEAVASRVITLIERALLSPASASPATLPRRSPARRRGATAFFLRAIAFHCARRIYHLCCYSPHWRIGWRFNEGPGVLERGDLAGPAWQALPDMGTAFAADPFPVVWLGRTFIFFEQLDHRVNKGTIFAQEFGADGPVGAPFLVLEEPWHLSYPFLIVQDGVLYMIPEASASGAVTLYRCVEFPQRWAPVAQLLTGVEAADATVFQHAGRFWMTSVVRDGVGGYSDTLAIHHAAALTGPWREHAQRPVLIDAASARPAGAVVSKDGALWRPVQDCSTGYGKRLGIARIDTLDTERFSQSVTALIAPGPLWPGGRLHTLNRSGRLECIDGAILTPKSRLLRRAAGLMRGAGR